MPEAENATPAFGERLALARDKIAAAAKFAGRDPEAVTLVAVSKTFPAERISPLLEAGHETFGENRVEKAAAKWPALLERFPNTRLRMVGPLQSKKTRAAFDVFSAVDSLDRESLAKAIAKEAQARGWCPELFIQVNIGEEPQKSGVAPRGTVAFAERVRSEFDLPVAGLMCLPPQGRPPAPFFALLAKLADEAGVKGLSMGMSGDFEEAVALGATHVRLGEAVFGPRG